MITCISIFIFIILLLSLTLMIANHQKTLDRYTREKREKAAGAPPLPVLVAPMPAPQRYTDDARITAHIRTQYMTMPSEMKEAARRLIQG